MVDFRGLSRLLLRIAGAVILVIAASQIPIRIMYAFNLYELRPPLWAPIAFALFASLVPILVGIGLLSFPGAILNRILDAEPIGTRLEDVLAPMEALAFAVLGMYFLVQSILDAVHLAAKVVGYRWYVAALQRGWSAPELSPDDLAALFSTMAEFVMALLLLLGGGGIARIRRAIVGARGNLTAEPD